MTRLRIGDRVAYRGRLFFVHGFSPMSVTPRKLHLKDATSHQVIEVTENELAADEPTGSEQARSS